MKKAKTQPKRRKGQSFTVTMENGDRVTVCAANADTAMMIASQERGQRVWSVQ